MAVSPGNARSARWRHVDWISAYKDLPASAFMSADPNRPLHLSMRMRYTAVALPSQQAYYIQLNQTDDTSFVTFVRNTTRAVDDAKPLRLIVDIRYNFGGDASR